MRRLALIATLLLLAGPGARAASPDAGGLTAFKDWNVVCDNLRSCTAFGWPPGDGIDMAWLKLARDGGPDDLPTLRIAMVPEGSPTPGIWRLAVDGKVVAAVSPLKVAADDTYRTADLAGPQAMALVEAMRAGSTLTALENGQPVLSVSLSGLSASLLWIDDHQQRVGAMNALARKGTRAATATPPAAPLLVAAPAASQAGLPKKIPAAITALLADCDTDSSVADYPPVIARLAPGRVLWGPVCSTGAYNVIHQFYVGDDHGRNARKIMFPEPPGSSPAAYDSLMNVEYDPATRVLSSFSKGRGLGDCGSDSSWVWDGQAFRLLSERVMPECKGVSSDDWPTLWRARAQ